MLPLLLAVGGAGLDPACTAGRLAPVLGARERCLAQVPPPTLPKLLVEMLLGLVLVVVAVVIAVEGWDHAVV